MSLISIPNIFTVGAIIVASQHNANFSIIYSDYNGNITDANISGSANISDNKLAAISTAGKVSGAALTSLSLVPAGAGLLPAANGPVVDLTTKVTGVLPVANGGTGTSTGVTGLFSANVSKTVGTIYQAATDGIVCGFVSGGGTNTTMISYSDATASPSTVVQEGTFTFVGGGPNAFIPVCFPVRKTFYYQVTGGSGGTINFMPVGV